MQKRFTRIMAAFALLVFMTPNMVAWGQTRSEVTISMSQQGWSNGIAIGSGTLKDTNGNNTSFTYTSDKGETSNAPAYYVSGTNVRFYSLKNGTGDGGSMTIIPADNVTITGIILTATSNYSTTTKYNVDGGDDITLTWSGTTGTVSGIEAVNSFKFRNAYQSTSSNEQLRITQIKITYTETGSTVATPTFDPDGGVFTEEQLVEINCETEGATIYYTTNGSNPDADSEEYDPTEGVSIEETTTLKAIAYVGTNASSVATATYTIVSMQTIAEARAQGTGAVYTQGTVTSISGSSAYIQDATAAINVYGDNSLVVGKKYTVVGTLTDYNGLLEITSPTCTEVEGGTVIAPEVMTIGEILASTNQGWFIKIEGATVGETNNGNTTLTQNGSSIVARNLSGATQGAIINLTGNIGHYGDNNQIANPIVIFDPSVSIDPATANPFTYVYGQGPSEEQIFEVTGAHLTSNDITVTVTSGSEYFEITDNVTYGSTVTIASGDAVSVRLKAGLAVNANYQGTLTIATQGAQNVTVALAGSVTNQVFTLTDLSDSSQGSITFSPGTSVEAGTTVTITPVANDAYFFNGTLTFYDDDLEVIETVVNVSGSYNYTMPAYNVGVKADFTAKPTFVVTCAYDENMGLMTATPTSAYEGQQVLLEYAAETGYRLTSIVITKTADGSATDITPVASGNDYTFTMPGYAVTATATFEQITDVTYDFTQIEGFDDWGTSYEEHVVEYPTATVTFALANHSTQTITNQPVTKGNDVTIVMAEGLTITSAAFECTQWTTKTQTITLHYSTDGGQTFTSTGVTSDDFSISSTLPSGTNAVKITFSSQSNQVGIASATVNIQTGNIEYYTLSLGNDAHINDYLMFVDNENNSVEFENGEIEIAAGANVYVSVSEVDECYVFTGLTVTYGDNQTATVTEIEPNIYYSFVMPEDNATLSFVTSAAEQYTLTVDSQLSNVTFEILAGEESNEIESGDEVCEGLNVTVIATPESGYTVQSLSVVDENDDPVDVINEGNGVYWFVMPSSNVTISATVAETTLNTYTLASNIVAGQTYLITNGSDWAMAEQRSNNRGAAAVDGNAGTIVVSSDNTSVHEFIIAEVTTSKDDETYYSIQDVTSGKYLCSTNASNNYLRDQETLTDNGKWTITITDGVATIVAKSGSRNHMQYNSSNNLFSCYAGNNTQDPIYLYAKNDATQTQTYTKEVAAYQGAGGYVLIASPVIGVTPKASNGFLTSAYDLYYFDQSESDEWRNFEASNFNLISGKGYLYASSTATTLTFTGTPYNGDGTIGLTYTEGEGIDFPGLNLVGNPFADETTFTIYDTETGDFPELNFLTMNATGDGFITTATNSFTASAMQGFFVQATGNAQQLQLEEGGELKTANLNIAVSRNRGNVIDNAIVNFGNASIMNKFYLKDNTTRVYIPQGNREMAVVRSAAEAEMPVSFRASENGTYTLAVEAENVEMNYLHLIDNLTGMDVDLLQTPSYTFEAKTSDYASRFRLVFKANGTNENNAETFAYFNGTNWTVSNVGDATLQVVDVTGRTVANQLINGNAELNLNQPAGVYVIRLVNGDNVKTQKVVVR